MGDGLGQVVRRGQVVHGQMVGLGQVVGGRW